VGTDHQALEQKLREPEQAIQRRMQAWKSSKVVRGQPTDPARQRPGLRRSTIRLVRIFHPDLAGAGIPLFRGVFAGSQAAVVVGLVCETSDTFARNRLLPPLLERL
jgi:hypothetical protein